MGGRGEEDRGTRYGYEGLTSDSVTGEARLPLDVAPLKVVNSTPRIVDLIRRTCTGWRRDLETLYLDRGFFRKKVIEALAQEGVHFVMPLIRNSGLFGEAEAAWRRGVRAFRGRVGAAEVTVALAENPDCDPAQAARLGAKYTAPQFLAYLTSLPILPPPGDLGVAPGLVLPPRPGLDPGSRRGPHPLARGPLAGGIPPPQRH